MSKPNFFIVGAPKCGTTALFSYLISHPMVFAPAVKEPNYFCEDFPGIRGPKTEAEYLSIYADATEQTPVIGDASVCYMYSQVAIQNIYKFDPQAKLIVMLRNPVEMVYSLHSQFLYTLNEDVSDFAKAWALQAARREGHSLPQYCLNPFFLQYERIGRMSLGLENVFNVFPAEQVKVIFFDDFRNSPDQAVADVFHFLQLPEFKLNDFPVVNSSKTVRSRWLARLTQRGLASSVRRPLKLIKNAVGLKRVSFIGALTKLNKVRRKRAPLSPEVLAMLTDTFADEITALERLTNRDLSAWRDSRS